MKVSNKFKQSAVSLTTASTLFLTQVPSVFAEASGAEVENKVDNALTTVQGILTGLLVTVGIVCALWIIIKRLPDADDPREKSEVYKSVGRVAGLVALGAAIVWLLPWVYSLFT